MAKPIMDAKITLFEGVLTEFNWGQHDPIYRTVDMAQYNPTEQQVDQEGALKEQIALYLRWCAVVAASDKTNKTGHFSSNAILTRRNTIVSTILNRMTREQPHHPALLVLANDYQNAINKGLVFVSSLHRSEQVEMTKNSLFIQRYFIFIIKTEKRSGLFRFDFLQKPGLKTNTSASTKINRMPVRRNC